MPSAKYIKLPPQFQSAYANNNYQPPLTVPQVEELTNKKLNIGDIVNFGQDRYYFAQLVGPDRTWIRGYYLDYDDLFIPIQVTQHLSDPMAFYAKQMKKISIIELAPN